MNSATIKQARTATGVEQLLEAARRAPSPDNNQPWAFRPVDAGIEVLHRRDRALPSDARLAALILFRVACRRLRPPGHTNLQSNGFRPPLAKEVE